MRANKHLIAFVDQVEFELRIGNSMYRASLPVEAQYKIFELFSHMTGNKVSVVDNKSEDVERSESTNTISLALISNTGSYMSTSMLLHIHWGVVVFDRNDISKIQITPLSFKTQNITDSKASRQNIPPNPTYEYISRSVLRNESLLIEARTVKTSEHWSQIQGIPAQIFADRGRLQIDATIVDLYVIDADEFDDEFNE
ncbi:MAG: hypothetical protein AAFR81_27110 [Chloroflexota bacterium]